MKYYVECIIEIEAKDESHAILNASEALADVKAIKSYDVSNAEEVKELKWD